MAANLYNFDTQEQICIDRFDKNFLKESLLLSRLFKHMEELIKQVSGNIKGKEYPDWTIEIFLINNLTLLFNSFDRLHKGYVGISQALLRPVIESIALSMYFFEFPKDETKYRKKRKSFYAKLENIGYPNWIEGVVQRIDKEGVKFAKGDPNKGQTWFNFLIRNLENEASNFLHANPDYILSVVFNSENETHQNYSYGPNWSGINVFKDALYHIIEATIFNIIVFDKCFNKHIKVNDIELMKEAINDLNDWKREYQIIVNNT